MQQCFALEALVKPDYSTEQLLKSIRETSFEDILALVEDGQNKLLPGLRVEALIEGGLSKGDALELVNRIRKLRPCKYVSPAIGTKLGVIDLNSVEAPPGKQKWFRVEMRSKKPNDCNNAVIMMTQVTSNYCS